MSESPMIEAALGYLKQGFVLMPTYSPLMFREIKSNNRNLQKWRYQTSKTSLRARYWFKPLRTEEEVRKCFARFPLANIQIVTGVKSGIVVLDVDYDEGGLAALPPLNLPVTRSVSTGRGKHYYFMLPDNVQVPTVKNGIAAGVTVMAEIGRVVAPPSIHVSGKRYVWDNIETAIVPLPDNIKNMLVGQKTIGYWRSIYYFHIRKRFGTFPILRVLLCWESFKSWLASKV